MVRGSQQTPKTVQAIAVALACFLESEGMILAEDTKKELGSSQAGANLEVSHLKT